MLVRALVRRLLSIVAVLTVLATSGAFQLTLYICAMSKSAHVERCCCSKRRDAQPVRHAQVGDDVGASLEAPPCCVAQSLDLASGERLAEGLRSFVAPPSGVPLTSRPEPVSAPARVRPHLRSAMARAPPEGLFLAHCALLI